MLHSPAEGREGPHEERGSESVAASYETDDAADVRGSSG